MASLFGPNTLAALETAAQNVFDTFKRALTVYIEAQTASIYTSPTYSRFGQHDQNVFNPAVTPQPTVISGCLLYGNGQPYDFIEPMSRKEYQQDKIRNSAGILRLKVDATGYALLSQAKLINVDDFNFTVVSTPRPHGIVTPARYTFTLLRTD